jgi:uncharacterized protein YuzE
MNEALQIRYDRASDVLYVTTSRYGAAYGDEEDAPGLIWRYLDKDDTLVGVTVMDYRAYWQPRFTELVDQLSSHFHIPPSKTKEVLEGAQL